MKKVKKKTIMIFALISIVLCGCPGCFLIFFGISNLADAIGNINSLEELLSDLTYGFVQGGWTLCLGGVLAVVPFILAIVAVVKLGQEDELEPLKPTGVSKEDPIPPTT